MRTLFIGSVLALWGCNPALEGTEAETPTYHRDVAPIVSSTCSRCHDGQGVGTLPLTTHAEVAAVKDLVAEQVATRQMPPWLAADGCADYQDDFSLSDAEIDTIVAWVDAGAPEGDEADAPPAPAPPEMGLPRVDYTLSLPEPYTAMAGEDDYRCFVLEWPDPALVTSVTGFTVNADNDRIVHHVIAYIIPPEFAAEYDALDGADGTAGYACFGGVGGPLGTNLAALDQGARWLGGWAPGTSGGAFPDGTGIPVEGGSRIVLQVHYHPQPGEASEPDQSGIEVMVDPSVLPSNWAAVIPFTDPEWIDTDRMSLPAGQETTHGVEMVMDEAFTVHSANLHMHTLGKRASLAIRHADGVDNCLLDIPRWDFDWQRPYFLSETVDVQPGDRIALECTWDNQTPVDLAWGDGTNDEMCLGTMYVVGQD